MIAGTRTNSLRIAVAICVAIATLTAAQSAFSAAGRPPRPALAVSPNPAQVGQVVTFNASASTGDGQGSTVTQYQWDLDGNGVFELNTQGTPTTARAYGDPQTVVVRLRITDNEGDVAETSVNLRINAPPDAGFIYQPSTPKTGQRIALSSTSSDPDGTLPPSAYAWDLDGDRAFDDATGETVRTKFAKPGTHRVRLQVTDADGAFDQAARTIEVEPRAPELMRPFPRVRLSGAITTNGNTEIDLLAVRGPKGAKAEVRCDGADCPFDRRTRKLSKRRVEFPEIRGRLEPGIVIRVSVTEPGKIGKFTRFKLREGKVPKREDRCLAPGKRRPIDCPRG